MQDTLSVWFTKESPLNLFYCQTTKRDKKKTKKRNKENNTFEKEQDTLINS